MDLEDTRSSEADMALSQYSILVVDDNELGTDLISRYLGKKGYNVTTAASGREALAISDIERFDLVLLDIYMPDIDGIKVLEILKKNPKSRNIPIVMFTASTDVAHRRMAIELSADEFIQKSESLNVIRERILKVLKQRRVFGGESPDEKTALHPEIRLLIVDDDIHSRDLLNRRINKLGYENIDMATSGEEALKLMKSHKYDLVFLDIVMPGLNGIEVLEKMHDDKKIEPTQVIMISSHNDTDIIRKCENLGASNYVVKPFHYSIIKNAIETSLRF